MAFEDEYKKYAAEGQGKAVADMYDARTSATTTGLKAAYDQNLSDKQAQREKIGTTYQAASNDMQAQYERDRRNLNQQAAGNGINTGAGSQQNLALRDVYNRDLGTLRGQEASAYTEADREIADLGVQYRAAVQQAEAEGDYRKMAALLDSYNAERQQAMQRAELLAGFGNFSGYEGIFDSNQISSMRNAWIAKNPLLAYNTGAINADQYFKMTGQYAPGMAPAPTYGGGGRTTGKTGYSDAYKKALEEMNQAFLNGYTSDQVDAAIKSESGLTASEKKALLGYKTAATGTTPAVRTTR
jgi:hypothetical protein